MAKKEASPTAEELVVDSAPVESSEKEQKKQEKAVAKSFLKAACRDPKMADVEAAWPDVAKAIKILFLSSRTSTSRRRPAVPLWSQVSDYMKQDGIVNELTLFEKFRIGRSDMRKLMRLQLKSAAPEERVWVNFNEKNESWEVAGIGAEIPAGYVGFIPV